MNIRYIVDPNNGERAELAALIAGGKSPVRKLKRMYSPKPVVTMFAAGFPVGAKEVLHERSQESPHAG